MFAKPGVLLRMEGAALFALCLYFYHLLGAGWGLFLLLFLWPDLFMLGYLRNTSLGASLYNLAHIEVLPILLAGFAYARHRSTWLGFALIWLAHIALDRALGFGLKYPSFFKDTHLQRVQADWGAKPTPPAPDPPVESAYRHPVERL
jgi:uncharacterized protein DUF4260